jgi:hypothetical protein
MKIIATIFSLFVLHFCAAQTKTDTICDLQSKNSKWKTAFESTNSKSGRIALIKEKVFADSVYSDYNAGFKTHEVIYRAHDKSGNDCGCRIFFHLNYLKTKALVLNLSENPKIRSIVDILDDSNIDEIIPLFDRKAESLYGTFGKCGAVILKTNDKKLIQLIKKTVE